MLGGKGRSSWVAGGKRRDWWGERVGGWFEGEGGVRDRIKDLFMVHILGHYETTTTFFVSMWTTCEGRRLFPLLIFPFFWCESTYITNLCHSLTSSLARSRHMWGYTWNMVPACNVSSELVPRTPSRLSLFDIFFTSQYQVLYVTTDRCSKGRKAHSEQRTIISVKGSSCMKLFV